jgi:hypothetical protein
MDCIENYKDGKLDGVSVMYSGKLKILEVHYTGGMFNGHFKTWWPSTGKLRSDLSYKMNVRDGKCMKWDENGNVILDRIYVNGKGGNFQLPDSVTVCDTEYYPNDNGCNYIRNVYGPINPNPFQQSKSMINEMRRYYVYLNDSRSVNDSLDKKMILLMVAIFNSSPENAGEMSSQCVSGMGYDAILYLPLPFPVYERKENFSIIRVGRYSTATFYVYDDAQVDRIRPDHFEKYGEFIYDLN